MNDDDQELPNTDLPAIAPDTFASVLVLLSTITDAKACGDRLRSLQERQAAAARATAELTTARAAFDQDAATARSEIATERDAVEKRRVEVHLAESLLAEREKRQAKLEKAWRDIGEPETVVRGLQDPEHPALYKARRAHGLDDAPDYELSRSIDGVPFPPNTTITRDVAVRARPSRSQRVRADQ